MITSISWRVNYSEIDQMGVVYHARYLVWLDVARTEYLRQRGMSYRELEARGFRMVVGEVTLRYLRPAHYDDEIRVRCWVREVASRRVTFAYVVERADGGEILVTGSTAMFVLDARMRPARLPDDVRSLLVPVADPIAIQ